MAYILFGVAGGITLFALSQLLLKNKRAVHYCIAAGFFSLSYLLSYHGAVWAGAIGHVPALMNSDISITFFIAPSIYLFTLTILFEGERPVRSYLLHFVLPGLFFIGFAVFNAVIHARPETRQPGVPDRFADPRILIWSLLADIVFLGYITLALVRGVLRQRKRLVRRRTEYRIIMTFLVLMVFVAGFNLANYLIRNELSFMLVSLGGGVAGLAFSLVSTRMAEYTKGLDGIFLSRPSRIVPQWEEELDDIAGKIRFFIEERGLYTDPEYKLKDLSRSVGRSTGQVSYSVNARLGGNFRFYVNSVRLDHIAEELVDHPEGSILDIAFRNGFNSKSSFNSMFINRYGLPPREFRKRGILTQETKIPERIPGEGRRR